MKLQVEIDLTYLQQNGKASPERIVKLLRAYANDLAGYDVVDDDLIIDAQATYPLHDEWLNTKTQEVFLRAALRAEPFDTQKRSRPEEIAEIAHHDKHGRVTRTEVLHD